MERKNEAAVSWLDTAVGGIRFGPDRAAVREELEAHMEDKAADLQRIFPGISREEAEERALSEMGDPAEIGKELARVHKPWLGWLWRASGVLLALVLISILGPGNKYNVVIALGIVFIPSFARVTRTAFAALRDVNYVKSARLMGASSGRILVRQILPNTTQVLLPAITIGFNNAVLAEASMSYLGIGVTPPDASLGYMLSEAQGMLTSAPWYALGSGGAIVLLIFGVGLIGEGLQRRNGGVS